MQSRRSRGRYTWYVFVILFRFRQATSHLVQIVGGLHLAGPELAGRIRPTVEFLSEDLIPAPTYVLPMHCSGFAAKIALEAALGEGCVPAGVGHKVIISGVPDDDSNLRPPGIHSR